MKNVSLSNLFPRMIGSNKRGYNSETRTQPFKIVNEEFERQLSAHQVYRNAFEAAQERVGRFYSSYESFKSARTQKLTRHK